MACILKLSNIHKYFGRLHVLKGVDLEVERGEVVCLIGRSGSGKSTVLRCINFLEEPSVGTVEVDGLSVPAGKGREHHRLVHEMRLKTGMVFQEFNLFPHMSVLQNVIEAPMTVCGLARPAAVAKATHYLGKVGMLHKRDEYPSRLSGGQKQRVAIARALAMEPQLMLFDEPTSALDPELTGEVLEVMRALAREGMSMIVVTHLMSFARDVANRVVVLDEGVIVEQGPPAQVFDAPGDERTAQFLEKVR